MVLKNQEKGNSLVVQWLGYLVLSLWGLGSVPGWVTKILQAARHNTPPPPPKKRSGKKLMF